MTAIRLIGASPRLRRVLWLSAASLISLVAAANASAQNRDPEEVFDRAQRQEAMGVDTHFGPSGVDRVIDRFKCFDAKLGAAGGPTF